MTLLRRLFDGSVLPVEQSIVVAQENSVVVPQLNQFIDELRVSGFLQEIVDRYMLAGVEVAPEGIAVTIEPLAGSAPQRWRVGYRATFRARRGMARLSFTHEQQAIVRGEP